MSSPTDNEWKVATGKNGEKALRKKGMTLLFPMFNTTDGTVMSNADVVERIAACLNFCTPFSNDYLKTYTQGEVFDAGRKELESEALIDVQPAFGYDYDRYGYIQFRIQGDNLADLKQTMKDVSENRWPLRVMVFRA